MIALIGAMPEEVAIIKEKIENLKERKIAHVTFYEGIYEQRDIVLMLSFPGKVNAAIATTLLLDHYKPEYVINIGTCGALQGNMEIGDMIVATEVRHFDVDATEFGYELGQVPQMPAAYKSDEKLQKLAAEIDLPNHNIHFGLVGTSDSFISDKELKNNILSKFPTMQVVEMEAAALYYLAAQHHVDALAIMTISDSLVNPDEDTTAEERQNTFTDMMKVGLETLIAD